MTTDAPSSSTGDFDLIEAARIQAQHGLGIGVRSPGGGSLPGYHLLREIHRVGQGVVYLAVQEATRRKVAIKLMREGPFAGEHDRAHRRFIFELGHFSLYAISANRGEGEVDPETE